MYGGGLGLVACCDLNISVDDSVFCFSEIKLGLVPAVILPFLGRRVPQGLLKRYCLSGQAFKSDQALQMGLVSEVVSEKNLQKVMTKNINALLSAGPKAISQAKILHQYLSENSYVSNDVSARMIAQIRAQDEAQEGFSSFFAKKSPSWKRSLANDWGAL